MSEDQDRKIKRLENELSELNKLFVKNDDELRRKIRDIRIANAAGVSAVEFTLANRMGITMDVVLAMLPLHRKKEAEDEIAKRISEAKPTDEVAKYLAAKLYREDQDF